MKKIKKARKWFNLKRKEYFYGVIIAVLALANIYGFLDEEQQAGWVALVAAIFSAGVYAFSDDGTSYEGKHREYGSEEEVKVDDVVEEYIGKHRGEE